MCEGCTILTLRRFGGAGGVCTHTEGWGGSWELH